MKLLYFIFAIIAVSGCSTTTQAAMPDAFWIKDAASERTNFRSVVHSYYDVVEQLCPAVEVPQHKNAYQQLQNSFDRFVIFARKGILEFDVNVAMADAQRRWEQARSVVDCAAMRDTVTESDILQSQSRIDRADKALKKVRKTAALALEKAE